MSLPISKLMNLSTPSEADVAMEKDSKKKLDNEMPKRYNDLKGLKKIVNKNHSYQVDDFDQFNVAMKQDKRDKGMQDLHMTYPARNKKQYAFADTEGWIDPAQRRRLTDPNNAPPFDFVNGSNFQKFTNDADETIAHNNVDLIKRAHQSYSNYISRYDTKPIPVAVTNQNPYTMPSQRMPNMDIPMVPPK